MDHLFPYPKMGYSFTEILVDPLTKKLLGHDAEHAEKQPFIKGVKSRLTFLLSDPLKHLPLLKIVYTAAEAFIQANATGPPLDFDSEPIIFPDAYRDENFPALKQEIFDDLAVDGDAVYALTPRIELFWLAKVISSHPAVADAGFNGRRTRMRINFWHQKLLQEKSDTLQNLLYSDAEILGEQLFKRLEMRAAASEEHYIEFLLERAAIRTYYGDDAKAREDLGSAASIRNFQFALIGALGKRTKYQERDTSQLVVLAKSRDFEPEPYSSRKSSRADPSSRKSSAADGRSPLLAYRPGTPMSINAVESVEALSPSAERRSSFPLPRTSQPENLPLNDDTLLEKVQFAAQTPIEQPENPLTEVKHEDTLPSELAELNPNDQPKLFPVDDIILLHTASSISNTSPEDGLTREETLPYALRVLEGGSSNWQVYTQALLVRSRIEGYKTRTMERGLLQLQALVDQVIVETTGDVSTKKGDTADDQTSAPTTFFPKLNASESASVAERLKYIHQLSPPLRWELEAELAQRWTQMGGLRTALEIYERLQMNAEVALCLAATDREAEAEKLIESMLFEEGQADIHSTPKLKAPKPADAPRLLCILGDIRSEPKYYVLAWNISNERYARAQRSLGRYFSKQRNPKAAAQAYKLALQITRLDTSTWFSLGCIQMELEDYPGAIESFMRVVQQEDRDAEAWSNLAVSLLRLPPPTQPPAQDLQSIDEEEATTNPPIDPLQHTREALRAMRRAAHLKRDDHRIWDNYLTIAASIPPSQGTPWNEIIQAMGRVVELRGKKDGEAAVDTKILAAVINHVSESFDYPTDDTEINLNDIVENENGDSTNGTQTPDETYDDDEEDLEPLTPSRTRTLPPPPPPQPRIPFEARALLRLIDTQIIPLATSTTLFLLLSKLDLWRHRPAESLSHVEKAWRATTSQPGIYESASGFKSVVDVTGELVQAYRALGERERERTGGLVEKNWRFKVRTAVRGVMGRSKDWEDSEDWVRLKGFVEDL